LSPDGDPVLPYRRRAHERRRPLPPHRYDGPGARRPPAWRSRLRGHWYGPGDGQPFRFCHRGYGDAGCHADPSLAGCRIQYESSHGPDRGDRHYRPCNPALGRLHYPGRHSQRFHHRPVYGRNRTRDHDGAEPGGGLVVRRVNGYGNGPPNTAAQGYPEGYHDRRLGVDAAGDYPGGSAFWPLHPHRGGCRCCRLCSVRWACCLSGADAAAALSGIARRGSHDSGDHDSGGSLHGNRLYDDDYQPARTAHQSSCALHRDADPADGMIVLAIFIIGMVLDFAPSITILVPILLPLVKAAGIDPVYFGVMFIMTAAVGMITPPVGTVLNTVCGISRVSMGSALQGIWPFLLAQISLIVLLVLFPALVTMPASWFY